VSCGCGNAELYFKNFASLAGVSGSDLNFLPNWNQSQTANGLAFDLEIGCDASNILCELYSSDLSYQKIISWALLYKAGEIVMEKVMGSGNVNIYSLQDREYLWGKRNHFKKEYDSRVIWFAEQTDISRVSNCFICNTDHKKVAKSSILI
jgi:hypothetical protein